MTIDGQSAGGASVLLHLLASEGKKPLFQQAIAQSVYRPSLQRPAEFKVCAFVSSGQRPLIVESQDCFEWIVSETGCASSGPSAVEKIECLREKDTRTLIRAVDKAKVKYV